MTKWSDYGDYSAGEILDADTFLVRDVNDTSLAATGTQKEYPWSVMKADIFTAMGCNFLVTGAAIDQGDDQVVGTLAWYITDAAGDEITVTVLSGVNLVSTSITVPSTMTLDIKKGAIFTDDASNATLTINGSLTAGLYQIFDWGTGSGLVTFGSGSVEAVRPEWWGATGDLSSDSTAAFNAAIQAHRTVVFSGEYDIQSTITIDTTSQTLKGDGKGTALLKFNPSGNDTLLQCSNGAGRVMYMTLQDFGIKCVYPTAHVKKGIVLSDVGRCTIDNISWPDFSWTGGNASVGIEILGRDESTIRNVNVAADYPIWIGENPNSATNQFDRWTFTDVAAKCLNADNYAITFATGVNITNWVINGRNLAVNCMGGIFYDDSASSGTAASSNITINDFRVEGGTASNATANGWAVYMDFGVNNSPAANITFNGVMSVGTDMNGMYFDETAGLRISDAVVQADITAADGTYTSLFVDNSTQLELVNWGVVADTATQTITDMHEVIKVKPYNTWSNDDQNSIVYGLWTFINTAHTDAQESDSLWVYHNGVRQWGASISLAQNAFKYMPQMNADGSFFITATCDLGYGQWFVNDTAAVLVAGTAGMDVDGAGSILSVYTDDGGTNPDQPYIKNLNATTQTVNITVIGN